MTRETLLTIAAQPYRQPVPVSGYRFGSDKKTLAVMGAMRGDEIQQMYICAKLVQRLTELESAGALAPDTGILVVPCAGQFSMNVAKRFWPADNTDINRMFPGYDQGETTQRLAAGIFSVLQGYRWGIQMASSYLPGDFVSHIRIMNTGYQNNEEGLIFRLPYLVIRKPRPYDTTTLNYNWQVWETETFSLYTKATDSIDEESANEAVDAVLRFLHTQKLASLPGLSAGVDTLELSEEAMLPALTQQAGILRRPRAPGDAVFAGDILAEILDPYTAQVREQIKAPAAGRVFFARRAQIIAAHELAFRIIAE